MFWCRGCSRSFLILLLACLAFDVATPQLAGAFHVMPGTPSDVITAPTPAVAPSATSLGVPRTLVRESTGQAEAVRRVSLPSHRPTVWRTVPYAARIPEGSSPSDTPDAD